MPQLRADSTEVAAIDATLADWRQGDVVLEAGFFAHVADPAAALTEAGATAEGGLQAVAYEVPGLAIVTQTCDIVRKSIERPFVEFCPLMPADTFGVTLEAVKKGMYPNLAFIPAAAAHGLVADLDRVMTVEKAVLPSMQRLKGFETDEKGRAFSQALSRKRGRFAFPDDFVALVKKFQARLVKKHDKETDEGRALRGLREIRVHAAPSWHAPRVEIFVWFVKGELEPDLAAETWADQVTAWLASVPPAGRFTPVEGAATTLADMTALDFVESDRLDLDRLSRSSAEDEGAA